MFFVHGQNHGKDTSTNKEFPVAAVWFIERPRNVFCVAQKLTPHTLNSRSDLQWIAAYQHCLNVYGRIISRHTILQSFLQVLHAFICELFELFLLVVFS